MWTKEKISVLLQSNDKAVLRAIVAIYNRQTEDEKVALNTQHLNKRGFSAAHARLGSRYAKWITRGYNLDEYHMARARKIAQKYLGQLVEIANSR